MWDRYAIHGSLLLAVYTEVESIVGMNKEIFESVRESIYLDYPPLRFLQNFRKDLDLNLERHSRISAKTLSDFIMPFFNYFPETLPDTYQQFSKMSLLDWEFSRISDFFTELKFSWIFSSVQWSRFENTWPKLPNHNSLPVLALMNVLEPYSALNFSFMAFSLFFYFSNDIRTK